MKLFAALSCLIVGLAFNTAARAADEFEVLPDVYGACIAVNKTPDGNIRNDCLSSATIVNKADGAIYACDAHLAINVEGTSLETTVGYKKAHCALANPPSKSGGSGYSIGMRGDFAVRRSPTGGGTVPARFYWRTRHDKLEVDVCFDFTGFKAFSGCIDAPLQN